MIRYSISEIRIKEVKSLSGSKAKKEYTIFATMKVRFLWFLIDVRRVRLDWNFSFPREGWLFEPYATKNLEQAKSVYKFVCSQYLK